MNEVARIFQSAEAKEKNANKARLTTPAREIYLRGLSSLGNCEAVAKSGKGGRGYTLPSYVSKDLVNSK